MELVVDVGLNPPFKIAYKFFQIAYKFFRKIFFNFFFVWLVAVTKTAQQWYQGW